MTVTSEQIKTRAREMGFDRCGIASIGPHPEQDALAGWLSRGYGAGMVWLARSAHRRADVRRILPSARSVIVTAASYHVDRSAVIDSTSPDTALIARYARCEDYHRVVGRRLDGLVKWIREVEAGPFEARVSVDSGPVQEKVFARHGGLGWIGKNTCLVNADLGSWVVLGAVVSSLDLEHDEPVDDGCGACTACLEACPTGALVEPHVLDARRCLAYLTVEHRGSIPPERREDVGRHLYGCDICQEVCPWNPRAATTAVIEWRPRESLQHPRLVDLWRRSDAELTALVEGTPMARARSAQLRRNLALAIGNSGASDGTAVLTCGGEGGQCTGTPSGADPNVREHVEWALHRLAAGRHHHPRGTS